MIPMSMITDVARTFYKGQSIFAKTEIYRHCSTIEATLTGSHFNNHDDVSDSRKEMVIRVDSYGSHVRPMPVTSSSEVRSSVPSKGPAFSSTGSCLMRNSMLKKSQCEKGVA